MAAVFDVAGKTRLETAPDKSNSDRQFFSSKLNILLSYGFLVVSSSC